MTALGIASSSVLISSLPESALLAVKRPSIFDSLCSEGQYGDLDSSVPWETHAAIGRQTIAHASVSASDQREGAEVGAGAVAALSLLQLQQKPVWYTQWVDTRAVGWSKSTARDTYTV
ncbi:MAG: hypothetical protein M1827_001408 [Pycnora praestabilis]|nr:MAG: hypothetical protein M1827_001408 [Pycnora praestabilis]